MLTGYWEIVTANTGLPVNTLAEHALITPARCCLKNIGHVGSNDDVKSGRTISEDFSTEEILVETAFSYLKDISRILQTRFGLPA
jgi:hypothetical protein